MYREFIKLKEIQKENLIKDFTKKRDTYFSNNSTDTGKINYLRQLRRDYIVESSQGINSDKVLDIGCGPALLYLDLLKRSKKYHAVDLVPTNLEEVKKNFDFPNVECHLSDLDSFE